MQIEIGVFPQFTALDVIGPHQLFVKLPGAEVMLCAVERREIPQAPTDRTAP